MCATRIADRSRYRGSIHSPPASWKEAPVKSLLTILAIAAICVLGTMAGIVD
jgi:hypothetical protein